MSFFKKVFGSLSGPDAPQRDDHDIRVATCALFLEIAKSDGEFSDAERHQIMEIIRGEYDVSSAEAVAITETAEAALDGSIDTWRFTNQINENYSIEEKTRVVELLWRVVYADGRLDGHEDYLVHKLATLLRLQHKQLIAAKLRVLDRDNSGD